MNKITFETHADTCKEEIREAIIKGLLEGGGEVLSEVIRNTRVKTGQLKGSWQLVVDEDKLEAYIGSPLENAIFEEFGTGEYALEGNGRKGGWSYQDTKGKWHFTKGKTPSRALHNAFISKKTVAKKAVERKLKELK